MERNNGSQDVPAASSELDTVIREYLQLFTTHQFKHFLATNSVIDWFGRTVRGTNNIHDFLKFQICGEFEHKNIGAPQRCEAIESKPSHYASRKVETGSAYEIPKLNCITGITSLKRHADSDFEESSSEDECVQHAERATTPVAQQDATQLTPPTSHKKMSQLDFTDSESACESEDDLNETHHAKRRRRLIMPPFGYLRHFPRRAIRKQTLAAAAKESSPTLDSSDDETEKETFATTAYDDINYLKVTALLQCKDVRSEYTRLPRETEINIRLSYRRNMADKQLKFILIIYERKATANTQPRIKRNLMSEFTECADEPTVMTDRTTTQIESSSYEGSDLSIASLRTPTKLSNTPPATPKRKPRSHSSAMASVALKRLSESPVTPKPTPKRAARCLRL